MAGVFGLETERTGESKYSNGNARYSAYTFFSPLSPERRWGIESQENFRGSVLAKIGFILNLRMEFQNNRPVRASLVSY
jgi:hypothetical protein